MPEARCAVTPLVLPHQAARPPRPDEDQSDRVGSAKMTIPTGSVPEDHQQAPWSDD